MHVYCTYYAPICRANGMEKASFARIVGANIENSKVVLIRVISCHLYVCMYVYCTYYAPICHANGMEYASFAPIVGAESDWFKLATNCADWL